MFLEPVLNLCLEESLRYHKWQTKDYVIQNVISMSQAADYVK